MVSNRKIETLLDEVRALAPMLLFGSLSSTYRTCGKPSCACHQGQRHGPYTHISYRADGRTRGYNVPADLEDRVAEGVAAWQRLQAIARELAEAHRIELGLGAKPRASRKARKR